MGEPAGFIKHKRRQADHRKVEQRTADFFEIELPLPDELLIEQTARCMDCGVPFCHAVGCPLGNRVPEFNDLLYRRRWREACDCLHATNNFPEITGRICPAPCETACTLGISDDPVLIRHIELCVAERGFQEGWIVPLIARVKTDKKVAVIGSGPAGLAAAQQLARAGYDVIMFEKDEKPGGILRYGIPGFKLDKKVLDRRLEQLRAEGVQFQTGVTVGQDVSARYLLKRFDAICLAMGAGVPRDLVVPGRGLENVHFAMDYLSQQNRILAGERTEGETVVSARDKVVAIVGGGDTGSDCVGTAVRQGAKEVHLLEILPKPPEQRPPETPWPTWPNVLRTSTSHEEGCRRRWCVATKKLSGTDLLVSRLHGCEVEWFRSPDGWKMKELPGTAFSMKVDLVLLAMGFLHIAHGGLVEQLGLKLDERGNLAADENCMTSREGVFAAGDARQGASLAVRAIQSGRDAATAIDAWLQKGTARLAAEPK